MIDTSEYNSARIINVYNILKTEIENDKSTEESQTRS